MVGAGAPRETAKVGKSHSEDRTVTPSMSRIYARLFKRAPWPFVCLWGGTAKLSVGRCVNAKGRQGDPTSHDP
jgi:hypothetical protein